MKINFARIKDLVSAREIPEDAGQSDSMLGAMTIQEATARGWHPVWFDTKNNRLIADVGDERGSRFLEIEVSGGLRVKDVTQVITVERKLTAKP